MKSKNLLIIILLFFISVAHGQKPNQPDFVAGDKGEFLLNGKPFLIRSGDLHYSRIPKEYWEHRIQMCKAMGLNTISMYLFWNFHEMAPGQYDFSGQRDIVEFVKLVQKNGMYCIVRPGPYVCAEWDMGGLPWWLLKKKDIQVRAQDPYFMSSLKEFLNQVLSRLAPLQIQNGGNIILAQVENEYASWGRDAEYMEAIKKQIRTSGFDKVQLFRCDWSSNFDSYSLDDVAVTLNFGAGANVDDQFKKFKTLNPGAPLMCSEYWVGWYDAWGGPHRTGGIGGFINTLKDMLDRRISFNLYMAHGGTTFGQWGGANAPPYSPVVSSYDFDAAISEGGLPTEKFYAVRNLLKNYLAEGETLADVPPMPAKTIAVPKIKFEKTAALFDNLPMPKLSENPVPMEELDQPWGSIMYSKKIRASKNKRLLSIDEVHDWANVYVNKKLIGTLDRRFKQNSIVIPPLSATSQLDILVEGTGRVNYEKLMIDRKGITEKVELTDGNNVQKLTNWEIRLYPVDAKFQRNKNYKKAKLNVAGWYKSSFVLDELGDTYLDMSNWGKGMVWVNGHNLGRFWKIGPAQTLYLPAVWLKKGNNEIIIFDLLIPTKTEVEGLKTPILDKNIFDESLLHRKKGQDLILKNEKPVVVGSFKDEAGWKDVPFNKTMEGRYLTIEVLSSQDADDNQTSIAEIKVVGNNGEFLAPINWSVLYADSENLRAGSTAEKVFDSQETVIWETNSNEQTKHPHVIVIDLGENVRASAVRILPRVDNKRNGNIKDFKIYFKKEPFIITRGSD